jgi:hypothetical protein
MSFLDKNIIECLSAKVTDLGRKRISEGNFSLLYFKVGDSEYDYNFATLDEYVMHPAELDLDLKYPLLLDTVTKLDYGTLTADHSTTTLTEDFVCDPDKPWKLNVVWTQKPAGLDDSTSGLTSYPSNAYASAKEYFGYTSLSGQTNNTQTSYVNSLGDEIIVPPNEQHTLALIHYSGENYDDYEDWLAHDAEAQSYFELNLATLSYHRSSGATIGAKFYMSSKGGYVKSAVNESASLGEKFMYLVDAGGHKVGKIFVGKRVIAIDDQEIGAALSSGTTRTWTLPAPRLNYVPPDLPCSPDSGSTCLLSGTTKDVWITYKFDDGSLPCNYYCKLPGIAGETNVSVKFGNELQSLNLDFTATALSLLVQVVDHGDLPVSDGWIEVDVTSQLPGVSGNLTPSNITGYQIILTKAMYENGTVYEWTGTQQFGGETTLPGSVKATRATNIHEMNFIVNLPATQFVTSQNPTKIPGVNARITDVGLYNEAKELLVIAKATHPVERIGFQQFAVKIDF